VVSLFSFCFSSNMQRISEMGITGGINSVPKVRHSVVE
jgi:hypothetical protein